VKIHPPSNNAVVKGQSRVLVFCSTTSPTTPSLHGGHPPSPLGYLSVINAVVQRLIRTAMFTRQPESTFKQSLEGQKRIYMTDRLNAAKVTPPCDFKTQAAMPRLLPEKIYNFFADFFLATRPTKKCQWHFSKKNLYSSMAYSSFYQKCQWHFSHKSLIYKGKQAKSAIGLLGGVHACLAALVKQVILGFENYIFFYVILKPYNSGNANG
jgi:hypothetical protein